MEVYQNLPAVLQDLELEYMTLPELVERGVALTPWRLRNIIEFTLGADFVGLPPKRMKVELTKRVGLANVFSDAVSEALIAMLLLGQLPLSEFAGKVIFGHVLSYIAKQSLAFKRVVYPVLIKALRDFPYIVRDGVLKTLISHEVQSEPSNSALELLLPLMGPGLISYIEPRYEIITNPAFILNHLDIIPVTSDMIKAVVQEQDWGLAGILLKRFSTAANQSLLEQYSEQPELSDELIMMLKEDGLWLF